MRSLLLLLLVGINLATYSQSYQWGRYWGGTGVDRGKSAVFDAQGNAITVGQFFSTIDFDPGPGANNLTPTGLDDIYIVKLNAIGELVWARNIGGTSDDRPADVTVDDAGNVIIVGVFAGTIDLDPGPGIVHVTAAGNNDILVVKLDPNGNFVWGKQLSGTLSDIVEVVETDAAGNVYVAGHLRGTMDLDPGPATFSLTAANASFDVFVMKLDAAGNFAWAKGIGGNFDEAVYTMDVDSAGAVYYGGQFTNNVDFDPGPGVFLQTSGGGQANAFISKLTTAGDFVWAISYGSPNIAACRGLALGEAGDLYEVAEFSGSIDPDQSGGTNILVSAGGFDACIARRDTSGNLIWAGATGGLQNDFPRSLAVSPIGVYTSGMLEASGDYDPGPGVQTLSPQGSVDAYISKLDLNGNFLWANGIGGSGATASPKSLWVDDADNLLVAGEFTNTVDFDPSAGISSQSSAGSIDGFLLKFSNCTASSGTLTVSACDYFSLNGFAYSASGTFTQGLISAQGCDSTLTLSLTINPSPIASISQTGNTLTASPSGMTYTWVDCSNGFAVVPGQSNASFTATQSGSYAAIVSNGSCTDTSNCIALSITSRPEAWEAGITLYPNPTAGGFTIDLGEKVDAGWITVRNTLGQPVLQSRLTGQRKLDLYLDAPAGMYAVEIATSNGIVTRKLWRW